MVVSLIGFLLLFFLSKVEVGSGCSPVIINASSGHFSSPNFPNVYVSSEVCQYTITVPSGNIIKVSFLNFALEPGDDTDCGGGAQGARLEFTNVASNDGNQPFDLCGENIPDPVYSSTNTMQLTLLAGNNPRPGFNASFVAITEDELCPSLANLTDPAGEISSLYYPRKYPANHECTWQIIADKGKHIELMTSEIDLPDCNDCGLCDFLEVQHGVAVDGTEGKICGSKSSKTFYSTFERLWVRFRADSDQAFIFRGFKATYKTIDFTPPVCPSDAIAFLGNGTFSSPNFPADRYPVNTDCSWLITVSEGKQVKLEFHTFDFDTSCACLTQNCGHIVIYDGNSTSSPPQGKFCGTTIPPVKVSSGRQMLVVFHSNFQRANGFNASYVETQDDPSPTVVLPTTTTASTTVSTTASTTASTTTNGSRNSITFLILIMPIAMGALYCP